MNSTKQLPENKKQTLYTFARIECLNGSVETTTTADPTSPAPTTTTTTHLLTDM